MNIADLIAALQSGMNPNAAVVNASMPGAGGPEGLVTSPPADAAPPAASPGAGIPPVPIPEPNAPQGAKTPLTNPQPATAAPSTTQSPPDLANMYLKIMQQNQNAAALDSGMTLVAAGLTPHAETRRALIGLSAAEGKGTGKSITSADLINLQKQQQGMQDMLLRRSMLGSLAKQYGLSEGDAIALETSGKLDEVIAAHKQGHLVKIEDAATGQVSMHHPITGKEIVKIGGPKPEEGEFVEGTGGKQLRSKRTGQAMGPAAGLPPTGESRTNAEMLDGINQERQAKSLPPLSMEEYLTTVKRDKKDAPNAVDEANLAAVNRGRDPDKQMSMEYYLANIKRAPGTTINVGKDGTPYPAPRPGYDYERNPDGTPKIGPDNKPIQYSLDPKAKGEEIETGVDIEKKKTEAAEVIKKQNKERVTAAFTASNVGEAVDAALELADKPGATGTFAKWGRNMSPVTGMSWDALDSKLQTVNANNVITALNNMRAASPSGGALGNVTEKENDLLKSVIANTNVHQPTAEFKKSMIRIKAAMMIMAEGKYDDADGATRFNKDLNQRVQELSVSQANKTSKSKIQLRE